MSTEIDALHLRRSIFVNATPARVWQEFESFERLLGWFDRGHIVHELTPHVGARVDMSIGGDDHHAGNEEERAHFVGSVLSVIPNQELTFETNFQPNPMPAPTKWTFLLSALEKGTLVEFFHHGYEAFGDSAADVLQDFESAWDMKHLNALRKVVENSRATEGDA